MDSNRSAWHAASRRGPTEPSCWNFSHPVLTGLALRSEKELQAGRLKGLLSLSADGLYPFPSGMSGNVCVESQESLI